MTSTSLAMKFSPFGVCLHLQLRPALRDSLFELDGFALVACPERVKRGGVVLT